MGPILAYQSKGSKRMSEYPYFYPWFRADDYFCKGLKLDCEICVEPAVWIQWECVSNVAGGPMIGICAQHAAKESRELARDLYALFQHDDPRSGSLGMFLALLYVGDVEWPPEEVYHSAAVQYVADRKAASNVGG